MFISGIGQTCEPECVCNVGRLQNRQNVTCYDLRKNVQEISEKVWTNGDVWGCPAKGVEATCPVIRLTRT
jgi:hypothetical protein